MASYTLLALPASFSVTPQELWDKPKYRPKTTWDSKSTTWDTELPEATVWDGLDPVLHTKIGVFSVNRHEMYANLREDFVANLYPEEGDFTLDTYQNYYSLGRNSQVGSFEVGGELISAEQHLSILAGPSEFNLTLLDQPLFWNFLYTLKATLGEFTPIQVSTMDNVPYQENVAGSVQVISYFGEFAAEGQEAILGVSTPVDTLSGSFTVTSQEVSLRYQPKLTAEVPYFAIQGEEAALTINYPFKPQQGYFSVWEELWDGDNSTWDAGLTRWNQKLVGSIHDRVSYVQPSSYILEPQDTVIIRNLFGVSGRGQFNILTKLVDDLIDLAPTFKAGSIELEFKEVGSEQYSTLFPEAGGYITRGEDASSTLNTRLLAKAGSITVTPEDVISNSQHYRISLQGSSFFVEKTCPSEVLKPLVASFHTEGGSSVGIQGSRTTTLSAEGTSCLIQLGPMRSYSNPALKPAEFIFDGKDSKGYNGFESLESSWDGGTTYWDDADSNWDITEWDNGFTMWDDGNSQWDSIVSNILEELQLFPALTYESTYFTVNGQLKRAPDWYVPDIAPIPRPENAWAKYGEFEVEGTPRGIYGEIYDASTGRYDGVRPDGPKTITLSAESSEVEIVMEKVSSYNYEREVTEFKVIGQQIGGETFINGIYGGILIGQSGPAAFEIQGNQIADYYEPSTPPVPNTNTIVLIGTSGNYNVEDSNVDQERDYYLKQKC